MREGVKTFSLPSNMKKYKITGAWLFGTKWVVYSSLMGNNRYATTHDRTGLTDVEALGVKDKKEGWQHGKFRREHYRQVSDMIEKGQKKSKIILNS